MTIDGSGFSKGSVTVTGISVGAGKATEITVDSPTRLTATFPPAANALPPQSPQDTAGAASVVVILSDGAVEPGDCGVHHRVRGPVKREHTARHQRAQPHRRLGGVAGTGHHLRVGVHRRQRRTLRGHGGEQLHRAE